jgi:hypothetical protein
MKIIVFIILLIPTLTFGQDFQLVFDRYNPSYSFDWSGFEVPDDYEVKLKFVEFIETNGLLEGELK